MIWKYEVASSDLSSVLILMVQHIYDTKASLLLTRSVDSRHLVEIDIMTLWHLDTMITCHWHNLVYNCSNPRFRLISLMSTFSLPKRLYEANVKTFSLFMFNRIIYFQLLWNMHYDNYFNSIDDLLTKHQSRVIW